MTIITIKTLIVTIIMFTNAANKRRSGNPIKPMIVTSHPNITNFVPHQSDSDSENQLPLSYFILTKKSIAASFIVMPNPLTSSSCPLVVTIVKTPFTILFSDWLNTKCCYTHCHTSIFSKEDSI